MILGAICHDWYDVELFKSSSSYSQGGSYTKGYDKEYNRLLETSFGTSTVTVTLFKNNQDKGMGNFDISQHNEKIKTLTFSIR